MCLSWPQIHHVAMGWPWAPDSSASSLGMQGSQATPLGMCMAGDWAQEFMHAAHAFCQWSCIYNPLWGVSHTAWVGQGDWDNSEKTCCHYPANMWQHWDPYRKLAASFLPTASVLLTPPPELPECVPSAIPELLCIPPPSSLPLPTATLSLLPLSVNPSPSSTRKFP